MNKKITVYYAKDADEAARIQAVLQANGIEAEEKSLGEHVYHDIYGGNGAYGREIQVEEEKEAAGQSRHQCLVLWKRNLTEKKSGESSNLSGKILHCRCRPSCYHPSVSEIKFARNRQSSKENGCTRIHRVFGRLTK